MLWQLAAILEKPVQTVVCKIHAQHTRTEKVAFPEKYHVLLNHSEDQKIGPEYRNSYMAIYKRFGKGYFFVDHIIGLFYVNKNSKNIVFVSHGFWIASWRWKI